MSAIGPVNPKIQRCLALRNQAEAELYYARKYFWEDNSLESWYSLLLWGNLIYLAEELQAQILQENTS